MTTIQEQAAQLVANERKRQVEVEGFNAAHDDQWALGQLASASEAYIHAAVAQATPQYKNGTVGLPQLGLPSCWPIETVVYTPN